MANQVICSGFGGQGVMALGKMLAYSGMIEDKKVSWLPSYGPEMRGGTANCSVIISDDFIGSPVVGNYATCAIVMNKPSLDKFESSVKPGGLIIVNSSLIEEKVQRDDVEVVYVDANDIAATCGTDKAANMVMLGAYLEIKKTVGIESVKEAFLKVFGEAKAHLLPLNEKALEAGAKAVRK